MAAAQRAWEAAVRKAAGQAGLRLEQQPLVTPTIGGGQDSARWANGLLAYRTVPSVWNRDFFTTRLNSRRPGARWRCC
jgi:hypothetical protein